MTHFQSTDPFHPSEVVSHLPLSSPRSKVSVSGVKAAVEETNIRYANAFIGMAPFAFAGDPSIQARSRAIARGEQN